MDYRTDYLSTLEDHCCILRRLESSVILHIFTGLFRLLTLSFLISLTFSGLLSTSYPPTLSLSMGDIASGSPGANDIHGSSLARQVQLDGIHIANEFRFYSLNLSDEAMWSDQN